MCSNRVPGEYSALAYGFRAGINKRSHFLLKSEFIAIFKLLQARKQGTLLKIPFVTVSEYLYLLKRSGERSMGGYYFACVVTHLSMTFYAVAVSPWGPSAREWLFILRQQSLTSISLTKICRRTKYNQGLV